MTDIKIKVLIIEDNPDHAYIVQNMLKSVNEFIFEPVWTDTLSEGMELTAGKGVVLLDLSLPDSTGIDTVTRLLERCPGVPIIVMTANDDLAVGAEAVEKGAQDFLVKGEFDYKLLSRAILYAIKRNKMDEAMRNLLNNLEERVRERTAQLLKTNEKLRIINEIVKIFSTVPDNEIYSQVLDVILKALKSRYGFFGYIDPDDDKIVLPKMKEDNWRKCTVHKKDTTLPADMWQGFCGKALREKRTVIFSGPFHLPEGHIPIIRVMVVPIISQDVVIGVISVGNKGGGDYDGQDQELLETIAGHISPILLAKIHKYQRLKERERAEEDLKKSSRKLQKLYSHLQTVREEERTSIAREIHDELGQILTALKIDLSYVKKKLPEENRFLHDKTNSMIALINTCIKSVQRISSELRPSLLDNLGIIPAIEWCAKEFQTRTGINCVRDIELDNLEIDNRELSTVIYRVLQETLTNVVRHAEADLVEIGFRKKDNNLILTIKDNGKGITRQQIYSNISYGIIGIRERARSVGGKVEIKGIRGKGSTLKLITPLTRIIRES